MSTAEIVCADCGETFVVEVRRGRRPIYCAACRAKRDREANRRKQYRWREANPEKWKAVRDREWAKRSADPAHLQDKREREARRLYGLEPEDFDRLLAAQNGVCAICRRPARGKANGRAKAGREPRLHVDHCHTTGRVRGLLCGNCNTLIGLANEDPAVLAAAIEYLKKE